MRFTTTFAILALTTCFICAGFAEQSPTKVPARSYGESEFQLGPDDVIQVFVFKEPDLSAEIPVRPDGKISLPLIGELPVSGKTAVELAKEISQKLTQYIANPAVNVIVKEVNSAQVSVLGEVNTPGRYKINPRATVLDAVALAGGFTIYAKRDKVTLTRVGPSGEQKRMQLNVEEQIKGRKSDLFYVLPYDKIYVQ